MATIIMDCGTVIPGESSVTASVGGTDTTFTDKVEAIGIHDLVVGSFGADRGKASEIQLVRYRDRASPKLAEKCSAGQALGDIEVYVFKNDNGMKLLIKLALKSTYVSRIEYGTADSKGIAYQRHVGGEDLGAHRYAGAFQRAGGSINDARGYSRFRARPNPMFDQSPGSPTDTEVERVWLNFSAVTWSAPGNVTGSFNNATGRKIST